LRYLLTLRWLVHGKELRKSIKTALLLVLITLVAA
jgi:hypothetical protein